MVATVGVLCGAACGSEVTVWQQAGGTGGTTTASGTATGTGTPSGTSTTSTTTDTGTTSTTTDTGTTSTTTGTDACAGITDCMAHCDCLYPTVVELLATLYYCLLCNACHDACSPYPDMSAMCVPDGTEAGCSLEYSSCDYGEACCRFCYSNHCATATVCAEELGACANDDDCFALGDCYGACGSWPP